VNALGPILLDSIVHATAFALVGTLVYLAWRRSSPAAGSLVAGFSLEMMAAVSLFALAPWPRWWTFSPIEVGRHASVSTPTSQELPLASHRGDGHDAAGALSESTVRREGSSIRSSDSPATPSPISVFVSELSRELRQTAGDAVYSRWGWQRWLATGFFVSAALGVVRLALGFWAIGRLRARSVPIHDRELVEAVEVVCAELSCSKRVEIRESAELATAATIGWRRPLLLLPADWREWNQTERLAVLAHEIAHVRRGDFLAGVAAQVSLAVQFYHPLAHWLATRLRLEQELAADAWAAQISGGPKAYVTTLAQIALRRDSRNLTWPARAFLPSRGTFVRRIEMLRNTHSVRHVSLSKAARLLTLGILAGLGLAVAGLRGPAASGTALAQQATPAAGSNPNASTEPYNLAFLPTDAKMLIALRPRALVERREFRALTERVKETLALHAVAAIKIEEIDQVLAFWEGTAQAPDVPGRAPMVPFPSGIVLRMAKPQEWKPILNQLLPSSHEVRHAGQTFWTRQQPGIPATFIADDRTLVIAPDDLLRELIEDRNAPAARHPWDEAWQKAAKGQVMLALDMRWVRRRLAQGLHSGPSGPKQDMPGNLTLDTISPLLEKTQSYVLSIDVSDGIALDLVGAATTDSDAKPVADTISALLTLARNVAQGLRQDFRNQPASAGEAIEWALQAADALLDKTRVDIAANYVHVQSKAALEVGEGVKLLAPAVTAAQTAARRTQSINNLKQIALAIHNYASQKNGLPAPVLYGGPNISIPYSWRVAVLPYLEHNDLYKQYNFDEPWDGPNNRKLIDKMPSVYGYPAPGGGTLSQTNTAYFVLSGEGTAFGSGNQKNATNSFMDIRDGMSNTIMVVEANRDIPWTKPEDIPFNPNGPLPELGGFARDVFNVAFADGSVRSISYNVAPNDLRALITRAGGEIVSEDGFDARPVAPQRMRSRR
jgi:prepilin-type processing-associated H-X9-DG protein